MEKTPFYASGLRFSCKRCSACCRYDAGFVYLSENDLKKLAMALKMDKNDFIKVYCRWVSVGSFAGNSSRNGDEVLSLKEKSNNDCIFWDNGCMVYMSRPLQCSTFPFWDNIISSSQSWEIAATGCPGINNGELFTKTSISENLNKRAAQPIINRADNQDEKAKKQSLCSIGGNV